MTGNASTPSFSMARRDRKSTRLNSSHGYISYAVFCLKKKKIFHTGSHPLHSVCPHAPCPPVRYSHFCLYRTLSHIPASTVTHIHSICRLHCYDTAVLRWQWAGAQRSVSVNCGRRCLLLGLCAASVRRDRRYCTVNCTRVADWRLLTAAHSR